MQLSRSVKVNIIQKSAKTEESKIWPTKIDKRPLLYLILAVQSSNFYHGFYNALDISSPKTETLSQQCILKCNLFKLRLEAVTTSKGLIPNSAANHIIHMLMVLLKFHESF